MTLLIWWLVHLILLLIGCLAATLIAHILRTTP